MKIGILIYEPRIEPLAVTVHSQEPASGELHIELDYRVRATNSRYNLVFPFYRSDSNEMARSAANALSWTSVRSAIVDHRPAFNERWHRRVP